MDQFTDVFSTFPRMMQLVQHEIKTRPGVLVKQWPYHIPEVCHKAIEEEVVRMPWDNITEESASPWSSPIVVVPNLTEVLASAGRPG